MQDQPAQSSLKKLERTMTEVGNNTAKDLQSLIERIENMEADKKAISEDIKDVYSEAKGRGYDTAAIKEIVKMRREDAEKRRTREAIVDTYLAALGQLADTPLGRAAIARGA
jgi:uncharacterized protein (UPF0335 family)